MFDLRKLGFCSHFAQQLLHQDLTPARVASVHGPDYELWSATGRTRAAGPPAAVGDWVALDPNGRVDRVLARRSVVTRKRPGARSDAQVLVANVDTVWVVTAVGGDLSTNRIERYLTLAWEGGVSPEVIVNKTDLGEPEGLEEIELLVPVHRISATNAEGVEALAASIGVGKTVALMGSSGVGKSTLLNALAAHTVEATGAVRAADDKGRHTTTRRSMHLVRDGVVIDTPGLREVGLVGGEEGIARVFEEVESLAAECRYRDCRHDGEPGCAVAEHMTPERLERYRALLQEQASAAARQGHRARQEGKRMGKMIREAKAWRSQRRGGQGDQG